MVSRHPDVHRNLLFGAQALELKFIDVEQFTEACRAWASRKETPLADLLLERGWITPQDKSEVDRNLRETVDLHGGDVKTTLFQTSNWTVRQALGEIDDSDIRETLQLVPPSTEESRLQATLRLAETLSRYTLVRLHSEGGLGRIWVVQDEELNRDVVLKELRPDQAHHRDARLRFLKEAQVAGPTRASQHCPGLHPGPKPEERSAVLHHALRARANSQRGHSPAPSPGAGR